MLRIGIVAGEVSGDLLAASLMRALSEKFPGVEFTGIAGPRMIAAGCVPIFSAERLSVMGLVEVLGHLPELIGIRSEIFKYFRSKKPDLFIGVDAPDFNLGLAKKLHRIGIPTVHYVSPSVWAWRQGRVRKIVRYIDRVLTLLPFEADLYNQYGNCARFVGHPMADEISGTEDKTGSRRQLGIESSAKVLAVLPGSRVSEIDRLGDIFSQVVKLLRQKNRNLRCVAPMVNGRLATRFRLCLDRAGVSDCVTIVDGMARDAIASADVVLTASGTASLEVMLVNRPMVVAYRIAPLTHFLVRFFRLLKINYFSLPNILAQEAIVPEFMQADAVPEKIAGAVDVLLNDDTAREKQTARFDELHAKLRRDASKEAARAIGELLAEKDRAASA